MIQCISEDGSATMATLMLKPQGGKVITLTAFDKVLKKIAEVDGLDTQKSLLKSRPFGLQYHDGIIQSIRRYQYSAIIVLKLSFISTVMLARGTKLHCVYTLVIYI